MLHLPLDIQRWIVLGITLLLVVLLFIEKIRPAFTFFAAVMVFLLCGIVDTGDFLKSLANESILSIFLLIFITAGIRDHFDLGGALDRFFGETKNPRTFLFRMTSGVAGLSAFMNNTPIVAFMMPYVYQWSKKNKTAPSKFLIPLSYAAIIGGMITVIGTSTNLVLNGLIESKQDIPLRFTDYLYPGLMVTVAGILFLYFIGYKLLPSHANALQEVARQSREYLVETRVLPQSSLIGRSITEANLRNLEGIYLYEIARGSQVITPVSPEEIIREGDALFFAGETQHIMELIKRDHELSLPQSNGFPNGNKGQDLIEAVVPANSELTGRTLKEVAFRENYDAAVVAIHRNGEKLRGKIGEMEIKAGDLMLISAGKAFVRNLQENKNLYMVSVLEKAKTTGSVAKKGFLAVVLITLALLIAGYVQLFLGLVIITAAMVVLKLLSISEIKRQLDVDLLIILVASLTFSTALIETGAAELVAANVISVFHGLGNAGVLVGLYLITLILTTFVTHVAAVSIVFPIAYAMGHSLPGVDMAAFYVAIAFAASASFHAPFSYQTNLMVYGPGGYKFKDFLKVGLPFTLIYSVICVGFILVYYKL